MKKIIFAIIILLGLTGCANEKSDKLSIVTTIFPEYDFVRQIADDKADITMLLPPGSELHSYEPSPKDIIKIQNCDLFIYVGGKSDSWVENLLNNSDNKEINTIKLIDVTKAKDFPTYKEYDEHVWTTPQNAIKIVNKISEELEKLDEKNAKIYKSSTESYVKLLKSADVDFKDIIAKSKNNMIVFADRYPLKHFSDEYGLTFISPYTGCTEETEPSIDSVKRIIDTVNENKISVVFYTEMSNQKMADIICEETGAKKMLFNTYHNVTKKEFDEGITYSDLMKHNIYALREALN